MKYWSLRITTSPENPMLPVLPEPSAYVASAAPDSPFQLPESISLSALRKRLERATEALVMDPEEAVAILCAPYVQSLPLDA